MNQNQNTSTKEVINQIENEMNNNKEELIGLADDHAEIELVKEESSFDEADKEQIEKAKKLRENKRNLASNDYIPLQNREKDFFEKSEKDRIYMSNIRKEEDKIKNDFIEEEKKHKNKVFHPIFEEDEDDEFKKYEKKLINKVAKNSKTLFFCVLS